jgi:hypothetical protein
MRFMTMIPQGSSAPTLTGIVRSVRRVCDFAATAMSKRSVAGLRSTLIRVGLLNSEVCVDAAFLRCTECTCQMSIMLIA